MHRNKFWGPTSVWGSLGLQIFLAGLPIFQPGALLPAQEIVDTRFLGEKGVVFESPFTWVASDSTQAHGVGDFNGDGFDDLLLVIPSGICLEYEGAVATIIYGRTGLSGIKGIDCTDQGISVFALQDGGTFSWRFDPIGDLDGNGLSEIGLAYSVEQNAVQGGMSILVGSRQLEQFQFVEDIGLQIPGSVLYSSSPEDISAFKTTCQIGQAFSGIGDFNGDGSPDLAISCPQSHPNDFVSAGKVFVVLDSLQVLHGGVDLDTVGDTIAGFKILGNHYPREDIPGELFGEALGTEVHGIGDFDGDGLDDFMVGADNAYPKRQYIIYGSREPQVAINLQGVDPAGMPPRFTIIKCHRMYSLTFRGAGVGDMDGDGLTDVILGVSNWPSMSDPAQDVVFLLRGRPDRPLEIDLADLKTGEATRFIEYEVGSRFGQALAGTGDLNGDGIPDFVIGAPEAERDGISKVGGVYAIYGRRNFPEVVFRLAMIS